MSQSLAALVLEKPADEKLHRPTFGADIVQKSPMRNEPSQAVVNGPVEIRRPTPRNYLSRPVRIFSKADEGCFCRGLGRCACLPGNARFDAKRFGNFLRSDTGMTHAQTDT